MIYYLCSSDAQIVNHSTSWLVQVALLSMTATAVGLDLSCASHVIFAEVPRTPDVLQQAEARAHRSGTPSAVNSYVLLCQRTQDVRAWVRLSESLERTSSLIEPNYQGAHSDLSSAYLQKLCMMHLCTQPHICLVKCPLAQQSTPPELSKVQDEWKSDMACIEQGEARRCKWTAS